jgi:phage-related protein
MTVFELVAKLTLDSSEYERDLQKQSESGGKLAGAWGKVGKAVKVGAVAIGAASAAVGALTKKSIDAYAEYEQLAGGVEKIFDKANISGIMEDANNAYKDLNMSANQYLAAINQTGATFAQTMGDQKGYDTARTGMKAIADYASGTGRNLDELNQKYALITRSTSSYQSIADQFSGILPATSQGFLEQAQSAGLLKDTYTKLTEVPIDEYQEAVTNMLEKGVTDMGLYGNTAKESMTTISGALAMTKAAWQNLVTSFANPDADIGAAMDNLITAIVGDKEGEGLLNQIIPAIQRAVEGVGKLLQAAIPALAQQLPGLIQTFIPVLIQAVTTLVTSLIQALPGIISTLVEMLPELVDLVINGIVDALAKAVPILVKQMPKIVKALASGLLRTVSVLTSAGKRLIQSLENAVTGALSSLASKVVAYAKEIPQKIKSGLGSLASAGSALIEGLWGGIKAKFDGVISRVKALASKLPKAVKKVLGIASPSKVFMEVGKWIPEGLALGIEKNMGAVNDAIDVMSDATVFTPLGATGNTTNNGGDININLNYDADADANDMIRDLARGVQRYRMAGVF